MFPREVGKSKMERRCLLTAQAVNLQALESSVKCERTFLLSKLIFPLKLWRLQDLQ